MNALTSRTQASRLVHHSDRGSQYDSASYRGLLEQNSIECSMSFAGDCYDKCRDRELLRNPQAGAHHHRWSGLLDARASTHDYIDVVYNRQRLYSSLGYMTPTEADGDADLMPSFSEMQSQLPRVVSFLPPGSATLTLRKERTPAMPSPTTK